MRGTTQSVVMLLSIGISLCAGADCFQDVAQRVDAESIPGLSPGNSQEANISILLRELETCLQMSGTELFIKLTEHFVLLKTEKEATETEFEITWVSAGFLMEKGVSESEVLKSLAPKWYNAKGKAKEVYFSILSDFARTDMLNPERDIFWDYDFSTEKRLLDNEADKTSELSLALLDSMFALAPGSALMALNPASIPSKVNEMKNSLTPLVKWHSWKSPSFWKDEDLEPGKATLNNLTSSGHAYVDLFIAEIVNVVHNLRTPEVDAFLARSTHPLVQRRVREPFVYVPLDIP